MSKKVFISCPMNGRTEKSIWYTQQKMLEIARQVFGENDLEIIDSYIKESPPSDIMNKPVWYIGKSIMSMANADYFIGSANTYYNGCQIESEVARYYDIPMYEINVDNKYFMPDKYKI